MQKKNDQKSIVTFSDVSKNFFTQKLYRNVNLEINPGDKIALMGVNGTGKSTFIRLIEEEEFPDDGEIILNPDYKILIFNQFGKVNLETKVKDILNIPFSKVITLQNEMESIGDKFSDDVEQNNILMERYAAVSDEFEALGGYSYLHIQSEFIETFDLKDKLEIPFGLLSGGEKQYLRLALALFEESDFLILDEPLSYFDKKKTAWLLNHIKESRKTYLIVSHNVDFLREFANKVFDINNYSITQYDCDYNQYLKNKKIKMKEDKLANKKALELMEQIDIAINKKENIMEKTENKRGHAVILRRLVRELEKIDQSQIEFSPEYNYRYAETPDEAYIGTREIHSELVIMENISKNYDDKVLYKDLNFVVTKDTRICIAGENGAGKSTLLKIIAKEESADSGKVIFNEGAKIAFVKQETHFENEKITVFDYLKAETCLSDDFIETSIDMLFNSQEEFKDKRLFMLSGGEKKRLEICAKTLADIDCLIIDEPTTFMDDYSRGVIANMLLDYQGAIILVTHDKWLMKKLGFAVYDIRDKRFRIKSEATK